MSEKGLIRRLYTIQYTRGLIFSLIYNKKGSILECALLILEYKTSYYQYGLSYCTWLHTEYNDLSLIHEIFTIPYYDFQRYIQPRIVRERTLMDLSQNTYMICLYFNEKVKFLGASVRVHCKMIFDVLREVVINFSLKFYVGIMM